MILRRSRRETGPSPFGSAAAAGDGAWPPPQRRSVLRALTRGQRVLAAHGLGDVGYDLRVLATWQIPSWHSRRNRTSKL